MSNLSTEHLRGGTIIKCSFSSKMYAKLKKVWWNLSLIICLMHEMLSCRVVLEHSMTGHKYCGPTSMPTRNTSRSQWRSQKFFSGRRGAPTWRGCGAKGNELGRPHTTFAYFLSLSFYHSSGSMTLGAHSHLSRVKSLSKKLSSGVGKPAICNNVMTKQAMTWKSWEGAQGFSSMGRHHSPIVSLAFHLRVLIKRNPFYDISNTCNRYCAQSSTCLWIGDMLYLA